MFQAMSEKKRSRDEADGQPEGGESRRSKRSRTQWDYTMLAGVDDEELAAALGDNELKRTAQELKTDLQTELEDRSYVPSPPPRDLVYRKPAKAFTSEQADAFVDQHWQDISVAGVEDVQRLAELDKRRATALWQRIGPLRLRPISHFVIVIMGAEWARLQARLEQMGPPEDEDAEEAVLVLRGMLLTVITQIDHDAEADAIRQAFPQAFHTDEVHRLSDLHKSCLRCCARARISAAAARMFAFAASARSPTFCKVLLTCTARSNQLRCNNLLSCVGVALPILLLTGWFGYMFLRAGLHPQRLLSLRLRTSSNFSKSRTTNLLYTSAVAVPRCCGGQRAILQSWIPFTCTSGRFLTL